MLDKKILDFIVCPKCKGELKLEDEFLVCYNCQLKYPIKNDIPILLIEEAQNLNENTKKEV
ncbi:MAG: Trm112 family protein [Desulfurella sp.]|uniref:Trm112 family protein n=1 Tax=Desulfurella sp. TaxID=1962857 RepID=UPI003C715192